MTRENQEIEVEVVEIDDVKATTARPRDEELLPNRDGQDRRLWHGRIKLSGSRWWPLWVIIGFIALGLFLTVGIVIGVVFLIVSLVVKLLRAILR